MESTAEEGGRARRRRRRMWRGEVIRAMLGEPICWRNR